MFHGCHVIIIVVGSFVLPCLFSLRLPCLLGLLPLVFRVLVHRLLLLRLPFPLCCPSFLLLACVCRSGALLALTLLYLLGLGLLLPCWCSPLPLVVLVLVVLPLPVVPLAVCCPSLLVLAVCWWSCPLLLFLLLVSARPGRFLVVVAVVGVRSVLPWVAVGGRCCGCPLAVCLLRGLGFPGLRRVGLVVLVVGGLVLPFLLPCSCRCFSSLSPQLHVLALLRSLDDKLPANLQLILL